VYDCVVLSGQPSCPVADGSWQPCTAMGPSGSSSRPLALVIGLSVGGALAAALLAAGLAVACKACNHKRQAGPYKQMKEEAGSLTTVIVAASAGQPSSTPRTSSERSPTSSDGAHHAALTQR
jgi:hypothetical protein